MKKALLFICVSLSGAPAHSQCSLNLNISGDTFLCYEEQASLTANGGNGTAPYAYSWSISDTNRTITVGGGTYTVTVTDAMACTESVSVTVTEQPTITISVTTTPSTGSNGTAKATITGGSGGDSTAYVYSWMPSSGQSTATITGLPSGTYTVNVTDFNGCTATGSGIVYSIACNVTLTATASPTFVCYGATFTLIGTGANGAVPYTYMWSTGNTTSSFQYAGGGTYSVTITDDIGCTESASVTVAENPQISVSVTTTPSTGSDGTATANVAGGGGGYAYYWPAVPAQSTATVTGLSPGPYTVIISDANSCTASASGTVAFISSIDEIDLADHISVYPNPASSVLTINYSGTSFKNAVVKIFNLQGSLLKIYSLDFGPPPVAIDLQDLSNGIYYLDLAPDQLHPMRKKIVILR